MRFRLKALISAVLLAAVAASGVALADRGGGRYAGHGGGYYGGHGGGHYYGRAGAIVGGALVTGALLSPWYYRGPYYYPSYPTVIEVSPPAPTVYIQQPRADQPVTDDAGAWWYYCNESQTYYPYVKECASPWQRVSPTPPVSR